jgi:hypothetical protein
LAQLNTVQQQIQLFERRIREVFTPSPELALLQKQKIKALIPDTKFRRRDPRFPAQKPNYTHKPRKFREQDFLYDPIRDQYRCPNGKTLPHYTYSTTGPYRGRKYRMPATAPNKPKPNFHGKHSIDQSRYADVTFAISRAAQEARAVTPENG